MRRKAVLSLILICLFLITAGCWDRREIEERGFILGVAVDKAASVTGQADESSPGFLLTLQKAVISKQKGQENQQGGSSKVWNIEGKGDTIFQIIRDMSTRSNLPPFFEHIQTIVIGEKVAREGVGGVMDLLSRDPEMRRRVRLFVAPGEARQVLSAPVPTGDITAVMLAETIENEDKSQKIFAETDLGEFMELLHKGENAIVAQARLVGGEHRVEGAAVFKKDRLVGWLSGEETAALNWIKGTVKGGVVEFKRPNPEINRAVFEIFRARTRTRYEIKEGKFRFYVRIDTEGNVGEISDVNFKSLKEPFLEQFEQGVKKEIRKQCGEVVKKVRTRLKADVFGFGNLIEKHDPDIWEKVQRDWDDKYFPAAEVVLEINVKVMRVGFSK